MKHVVHKDLNVEVLKKGLFCVFDTKGIHIALILCQLSTCNKKVWCIVCIVFWPFGVLNFGPWVLINLALKKCLTYLN